VPTAPPAAASTSGRVAWFLERRQLGRRLRRIADHAAVAGDERDAARHERPEPVGLAVHVGFAELPPCAGGRR
jgi:hypothetical protein